MPTKTGDKIRIIVLGTGPDAETARAIAESDADVALAKQFTKTVTHLVADDTVKPTEARVKKAEEAGVPVLTVAEFRALLVAGPEDEADQAVEAELEEAPAQTPAAVVETDVIEASDVETGAATDTVDETPDAAPKPVEETAAATEPVQEPEPVADPEPVAAEEPTPPAEPATAAPEPESEPAPAAKAEPVKDDAPVAEAIDEPEAAAADPEKTVPSQAEAPAVETTTADAEKAKPGLLAKIRSIFGLTGAKK